MINLLNIPELIKIAPRIVWFEPPEKFLENPSRFLGYAMRYATHEDMTILRKYILDQDFAKLLDEIPPGIVDARSWAYCNALFNRYPSPPMPMSRFE